MRVHPLWISFVFALGLCSLASGQTVAAGSYHSAVVTPDHALWIWGDNWAGQLGRSGADALVPEWRSELTGVVAVAASEYHTLVLLDDGTVRAFGLNSSGQLGDGTTTNRIGPVVVTGLSNVVAIAAGGYHSVALTSSGQVWTWGQNYYGQIGDGTTVNASPTPTLVPALNSVAAITAGMYHTIAVRTDGTVWGWGQNGSGSLGDGTSTQRTSPVQMTGVTDAITADAGDYFTLVLQSDGDVLAVGQNVVGQLGDDSFTQRTTAVPVSGLTGVTAIRAGTRHSVALKSNGTVWTWGGYSYGALGAELTTHRKVPAQVLGITAATIGAGGYHTVAVTTNGTVLTWGLNDQGQLGDGRRTDRAIPAAISEPGYEWKVGAPVFTQGTGTYSSDLTIGVTSVTSGAAIHYTLDGTEPDELDPLVPPTGVVIDRSKILTARAWVAGRPASLVTTATYTLKVAQPSMTPWWGTYTQPRTMTMSLATSGAVIRYTTDGSTPTVASPLYTSPFTVATTTTFNVAGFRDGWSTSDMVTDTVTLYYGTANPPVITPAAGTYTDDVTVSMSSDAPGALIRYTTNGTTPATQSPLYSGPFHVGAGATVKAKVYHPDMTASAVTSVTYAIQLSAPSIQPASGTYDVTTSITVASAAIGATLRYTLNGLEPGTSDPVVPATGLLPMGNFVLKVKAFKTGATTSPTSTVDYTTTGTLTSGLVTAGSNHAFGLLPDGAVWAWGLNGSGELGIGSYTATMSPVRVNGLSGILELEAGGAHTVAITRDHQVLAWGHNQYGQIGRGVTSNTPDLLPVPVPGVAASHVAAGRYHSIALDTDGSVWTWGENSYGAIGDNSTTNRPSAVHLSLAGVSRVAAGDYFSGVVKADGSVWMWGYNAYGQLGIGSTTNSLVPAQVSGISTAVALSAGESHTLAVLSDGTVRAWGRNSSGRLGDGTNVQRTSPITVSGLTDVAAVAAGWDHSLALKTDGTVWAWGYNGSGALGDGTQTARLTPVAVVGLPGGIVSIAAGESRSFALAADGSVWAWGGNTYGRLGDGTTSQRLTPVMIAAAGTVWKLPIATLSLPSGRYFETLSVVVAVGDPTATLHYTTNGNDPTTSDPTVSSGTGVDVDHSLTLKARAFKSGAPAGEVATRTYELKVVTPSISPASGQYVSTESISFASATPSATYTYTLDGTEPMAGSTTYTGAFTVGTTKTIKVRAYRTGWTPSDSTAASFWVSGGTLAAPVISPGTGSYSKPTLVTLTAAAGTTIRYRLDGVDPDAQSPRYTGPLLLAMSANLRARAFQSGMEPSSVATAVLSFTASGVSATPMIVSPGGIFVSRQTVSISGASGATLRYTLTGVDPTTSDPVVPGNGVLTIDRAAILKVRAWESGLEPSVVARADFVITGRAIAGRFRSGGLASDGTLWAWGDNALTAAGNVPEAIMTGVRAVSTADGHTMVLKEDGTVWGFGPNGYGQLGGGDNSSHTDPVQALSLTDVVAVSAGYNHSLALKRDGTVWAWGKNTDGQLGDGTTTTRSQPVQVVGLTGVTHIAAGNDFSLAIQSGGASSGTLWTWGYNQQGELADGSRFSRLIPVKAVGVGLVADVDAGNGHAIAKMSDGSVAVWGNVPDGLGTGKPLDSTVAVPIRGLGDTRVIDAHYGHVLTVESDGTVWGMGYGATCRLGGHYSEGHGAAIRMQSFDSGIYAAAGTEHSMLQRWDGTVWPVGYARLGFGPLEERCTPAPLPNFTLAPNAWLMTDADGDGVPAWREYLLGLDPIERDTNHDGVDDGIEASAGIHPDHDPDGDGIASPEELARGTDPFVADTDADGAADGVDAFPLDPTRDEPLEPTSGDATAPTITLTAPTNAVPRP